MLTPERRSNPRSKVELSVHVRSHADVEATIKVISRSGALVRAATTLPTGEPVQLHLTVGEGEGVDLMGRVLRSTPADGGYEWAIMFAPLPPALGERFDELLAARSGNEPH
jgi:hypothetical protein